MRLPNQYENMISMTTLDYIEQKYRTATLTELCGRLHLPMHVLSKMIKKSTGFNFKELLQRKRLNKAVELMCETDLPVSDIIAAVGYENNSYFHRVFKEHYHMIVEIPVFFSKGKTPMRAEIQIRTNGMDFWATLEHQLRYKQNIEEMDGYEDVSNELLNCARTVIDMDNEMQRIKNKIGQFHDI